VQRSPALNWSGLRVSTNAIQSVNKVHAGAPLRSRGRDTKGATSCEAQRSRL
jgi:hypothetical protein